MKLLPIKPSPHHIPLHSHSPTLGAATGKKCDPPMSLSVKTSKHWVLPPRPKPGRKTVSCSRKNSHSNNNSHNNNNNNKVTKKSTTTKSNPGNIFLKFEEKNNDNTHGNIDLSVKLEDLNSLALDTSRSMSSSTSSYSSDTPNSIFSGSNGYYSSTSSNNGDNYVLSSNNELPFQEDMTYEFNTEELLTEQMFLKYTNNITKPNDDDNDNNNNDELQIFKFNDFNDDLITSSMNTNLMVTDNTTTTVSPTSSSLDELIDEDNYYY